MLTAKDFGQAARDNKINAPTLDDNFLNWLKEMDAQNDKARYFSQWWEGWYAAIDERLTRQGRWPSNDKSTVS